MGTVKIHLAVETADGRTVRTSIEIVSEHEATAQTQAAVAGAISAILQPAPIPTLANAANPVRATDALPALAAVPPSATLSKDGALVTPMLNGADAAPMSSNHDGLAVAMGTGASPAITDASISPSVPRRDWSKYSVGFGIVLVLMALAVAAIFPPLVPPKQRIEVFMMSFAFGLLGTLSLFSGAMPRRDGAKPTANPAIAAPKPTAARSANAQAARELLLRRGQTGRASGATMWGLGFGAVFVLAGISAPFLFPNTGPDERFLMMLGFAPVVVIGVILMAVFWRRMRPPQPSPAFATATPSSPSVAPTAPRPTRAPVARAPNDAAFKFGVPAALAAIGVIMVLVLILVVVATLVPLLTR